MATATPPNSDATESLLDRVVRGDGEALGELLTRHRQRLKLMVRIRMDSRLQGRVDPSDVIQEACLEASTRLGEYLRDRPVPFYLWLRFLTAQRLAILHRHHLGTRARDAGREVSLYQGTVPDATSAALAAQLVGHRTTPSEAAVRAEMQLKLQEALNAMDPIDREVLALRHFERLTNGETAALLGLRESTASQRYARALLRLKTILTRAVDPSRGE